jgi:hypothetical protein
MEDFFAWHYEKMAFCRLGLPITWPDRRTEELGSGGYQSTSDNAEIRPVWKEYWKISLPHKVLIFGWIVIHNGLATQPNKQRRNIVVSESCEICGDGVESVSHTLIYCQHAPQLRSAMRLVWVLPDRGTVSLCLATKLAGVPHGVGGGYAGVDPCCYYGGCCKC